MPSPEKRLIASPSTVLPAARIVSPFASGTAAVSALVPFSCIFRTASLPVASVLALAPRWV